MSAAIPIAVLAISVLKRRGGATILENMVQTIGGGLVCWWVESGTAAREGSGLGASTLFGSGLIAGGSICGILFAVLVGTDSVGPFQAGGDAFPWFRAESSLAQIASGLLFLSLAAITVRTARRAI